MFSSFSYWLWGCCRNHSCTESGSRQKCCLCVFAECRNSEVVLWYKTWSRWFAEKQTAAWNRAGKSTAGEQQHGETAQKKNTFCCDISPQESVLCWKTKTVVGSYSRSSLLIRWISSSRSFSASTKSFWSKEPSWLSFAARWTTKTWWDWMYDNELFMFSKHFTVSWNGYVKG